MHKQINIKIFCLLFTFLSLSLTLIGCRESNSEKTKQNNIGNVDSTKEDVTPVAKGNVNFYLVNSLSINGYVNGSDEFRSGLYDFLKRIDDSKQVDSIRLFYINSEIVDPQIGLNNHLRFFNTTTFTKNSGDLTRTNIAKMIKMVYDKAEENDISIFVTDGIFSPGNGVDANKYMQDQQTDLRSETNTFLKKVPTTALIIYQLSSNFEGIYYNKVDKHISINERRPYYIWILGELKRMKELLQKISLEKLGGVNVENVYSISSGQIKVNYAIVSGSGNFRLDKQHPKTTIEKLKKDEKIKAVRFATNVDFSDFILSEDYLTNPDHYTLNNKAYNIEISKASSNSHGYSHKFLFNGDHVSKGPISLQLNYGDIPSWVEEANKTDGDLPEEGKTYGIQHQIEAINEAFTEKSKYYTEIKLKIE